MRFGRIGLCWSQLPKSFALLVALGLTGCARPAKTDDVAPYGTKVKALREGWHLVSGQSTAVTGALKTMARAQWVAFSVDHDYEPGTGEVEVRIADVEHLEPNRDYWLYVGRVGEVAAPPQGSPPIVSTPPMAWGQFFSPSESLSVSLLGARRVLAWDVLSQRFYPITKAELEASELYWVEFERPCEAGLWGFEDGKALSVKCPLHGDSVYVVPSEGKGPLAPQRVGNREKTPAPDLNPGPYMEAQSLMDGLFDHSSGAQREYVSDVLDPDDAFLVRHGRAWAYGQGITLALYSRDHDMRAEKIADYVCQTAVKVRDDRGEVTVGGWHFSSNTHLDNWKDARLVTGANAWVLHGLGVFLVSGILEEMSAERQQSFYDCYMDGLYGLMVHYEPEFDLMTAGWTTQGLMNADAPSLIVPMSDPTLSWAYYDILDAVGYDQYDESNPPAIQTLRWGNNNQAEPVGVHVISPVEHRVLGERAKATNVVTEHNLDTLSVINHLLKHWDEIVAMGPTGGSDAPMGQRYSNAQWTEFRDRLNQSIFVSLWDEKHGRVVTGGEVVDGEFLQNPFSAIDNCSWLSMSVDHTSISRAEREKLARCLDYTIAHFTKELGFEGTEYYGAHYFPKGFKDRYIRPNQDQERLYHIEGTAGLILGLLYFADAHPEHERSPDFRNSALRLWNDMQLFVQEHDFPYSTHRVLDLMATLDSNTSAVWFMQVYNYLAKSSPSDGSTDSTDAPPAPGGGDLLSVAAEEFAVENWPVARTSGTLLEDVLGEPWEKTKASRQRVLNQLKMLPQSWTVDVNGLGSPVQLTLTALGPQGDKMSVQGFYRVCSDERPCTAQMLDTEALFLDQLLRLVLNEPASLLETMVFPFGQGRDDLAHARSLRHDIWKMPWFNGLMIAGANSALALGQASMGEILVANFVGSLVGAVFTLYDKRTGARGGFLQGLSMTLGFYVVHYYLREAFAGDRTPEPGSDEAVDVKSTISGTQFSLLLPKASDAVNEQLFADIVRASGFGEWGQFFRDVFVQEN